MGKVCIACGAAPLEPVKPAEQPEDCPDCGGKETVKEGGKPAEEKPSEEEK